MQIQLTSRGLAASQALNDLVVRHCHFALGRFAPLVRSVRVRLSDENGPRGGVDKRCQVVVQFRRQAPVVLEGSGDALEPLVAGTFDRLGRTVARIADRRRTDVRARGPFAPSLS